MCNNQPSGWLANAMAEWVSDKLLKNACRDGSQVPAVDVRYAPADSTGQRNTF